MDIALDRRKPLPMAEMDSGRRRGGTEHYRLKLNHTVAAKAGLQQPLVVASWVPAYAGKVIPF
jgi:hypothetical protein